MDVLSSDIASQVANRHIHGPFASPPFDTFRTLPIRAMTCKHSSKVRCIHHLSWPEGNSVNDRIPDSKASIVYDMVEQAIQDLINLGPGFLIIKLNLKSAFCHIPICPDDWPLLGFEWLRKLYYDTILTFGMRSAPYIFNLFAEALHWILQHNLSTRMHHYLDNFLTIFP